MSAAGNWQFFIPGALYNRNDTDHDGVEDYLGSYVQDYRDDRLGSLTVLAYAPATRRWVACSRVGQPGWDTAVSNRDLADREFVTDTDVGSLGLAPTAGSAQITFRASYPFAEEHSFCVSADGSGWAGYLDICRRPEFQVTYRFRTARCASLGDAVWDVTSRQVEALSTRRRHQISPFPRSCMSGCC